MSLPNFLIIGAHKSGTTSLYRYLSQHPDVYMSPVKEPAYFVYAGDKVKYQEFDGSPWRSRFTTLEDYEALFEGVESEVAVGEASTLYLYHPRAPQRIKEQIPDAKFIAILRNPVDRAYSNYQFARMQGREPLETFREALEAEEKRIDEGWAPLWHYKAKGLYSAQLERYKEFFPDQQIRVYLYDDLKRDSSYFLKDVFSYLSVDTGHKIQTDQQFNVTKPPRNLTLYQFLRRSKGLGGTLKRMFPKQTRRRLKTIFFQKTTRALPPISPEDREYLLAYYQDEVVRLERVLGKSLQSWTS